MLGYFVDPAAPPLERHTRRAGELREARMREMLARLGSQGIEVTFEEVETCGGSRAGEHRAPPPGPGAGDGRVRDVGAGCLQQAHR